MGDIAGARASFMDRFADTGSFQLATTGHIDH